MEPGAESWWGLRISSVVGLLDRAKVQRGSEVLDKIGTRFAGSARDPRVVGAAKRWRGLAGGSKLSTAALDGNVRRGRCLLCRGWDLLNEGARVSRVVRGERYQPGGGL